MYPYAGSVRAIGRVGALIDVRAGLHSDLTGRENVYLYGSLLGLRRKEVARRIDEIVAFSELENAVDRQLKFYSTGMHMRLGFAVAAFLEPDVLGIVFRQEVARPVNGRLLARFDRRDDRAAVALEHRGKHREHFFLRLERRPRHFERAVGLMEGKSQVRRLQNTLGEGWRALESAS